MDYCLTVTDYACAASLKLVQPLNETVKQQVTLKAAHMLYRRELQMSWHAVILYLMRVVHGGKVACESWIIAKCESERELGKFGVSREVEQRMCVGVGAGCVMCRRQGRRAEFKKSQWRGCGGAPLLARASSAPAQATFPGVFVA